MRKNILKITMAGAAVLVILTMTPVPAPAAIHGFGTASNPGSEISQLDGMISTVSQLDGTISTVSKADLPLPDFSEISLESEKERLREALQTLDELGLSPVKLTQRFLDFLSRPQNREKIDQIKESAQEKAQETVDGLTKDENSPGRALQNAAEETGEKVGEIIDQAADRAAEEAKKKVTEKVTEELEDVLGTEGQKGDAAPAAEEETGDNRTLY